MNIKVGDTINLEVKVIKTHEHTNNIVIEDGFGTEILFHRKYITKVITEHFDWNMIEKGDCFKFNNKHYWYICDDPTDPRYVIMSGNSTSIDEDTIRFIPKEDSTRNREGDVKWV